MKKITRQLWMDFNEWKRLKEWTVMRTGELGAIEFDFIDKELTTNKEVMTKEQVVSLLTKIIVPTIKGDMNFSKEDLNLVVGEVNRYVRAGKIKLKRGVTNLESLFIPLMAKKQLSKEEFQAAIDAIAGSFEISKPMFAVKELKTKLPAKK